MWSNIVNKLRTKRIIFLIIGSFILFIMMYTLLDHFNGGYYLMVNIIKSFISSLMISISTIYFKQSGKEGKGTSFTELSFIFGILTYGCRLCVIAFFASIDLCWFSL